MALLSPRQENRSPAADSAKADRSVHCFAIRILIPWSKSARRVLSDVGRIASPAIIGTPTLATH